MIFSTANTNTHTQYSVADYNVDTFFTYSCIMTADNNHLMAIIQVKPISAKISVRKRRAFL